MVMATRAEPAPVLPASRGWITLTLVISGHNNIGGAVFRALDRLAAGDQLTLWAEDGAEYTYVVEERHILPYTDASPAEQAAVNRWIGDFGDRRLTLVTCWPADGNSHRVIVVARPLTN